MASHDSTVAIVTGASRGIGLGIAQRLVQEGGRVVLTGRKADALEEAVAGSAARGTPWASPATPPTRPTRTR